MQIMYFMTILIETTAGRGDYALVTDFNTNSDVIQVERNQRQLCASEIASRLPRLQL
jgi:hypothetical protein